MREYAKKPESQSCTLDSNPKASRQAPIDVILQRYKERNIQQYAENEELIQGKLNTAQPEEIEEDELLQGKFESVPASEQESIQREQKPNNTGLPDNLKTGIENLSGYSMDDVKVHYNSRKPAQLNALAYAQGTDIHVAPGQEKHLPHEAWHVVQQKQGRVQPTMQLQGVNVNDNEGLEKEADLMGVKSINSQSNTDTSYKCIKTPVSVVQGFWPFDGIMKFLRSLFTSQDDEDVLPEEIESNECEEDSQEIPKSSDSEVGIEEEDTISSSEMKKKESVFEDKTSMLGSSIPPSKKTEERKRPMTSKQKKQSVFEDKTSMLGSSIPPSKKTEERKRPMTSKQKKQLEGYIGQIGTKKLIDTDKLLREKIRAYVAKNEFNESEFNEIESAFNQREKKTVPKDEKTTKDKEYTDYQFQNIINMHSALKGAKGYENELILSIKRWSNAHQVDAYLAIDFIDGDKGRGKHRVLLSRYGLLYRIEGVADYHEKYKWLFQTGGKSTDDLETMDESMIEINNCLINAIARAFGREANLVEITRIRQRLRDERGYRFGSMLYAAPAVVNIIRQELGITNTIIVHYPNQPDEIIEGTELVLHIYNNGALHFQHDNPNPQKKRK